MWRAKSAKGLTGAPDWERPRKHRSELRFSPLLGLSRAPNQLSGPSDEPTALSALRYVTGFTIAPTGYRASRLLTADLAQELLIGAVYSALVHQHVSISGSHLRHRAFDPIRHI